MFVLAHLSDPHLSPFLRPGFFELIGKRALGYLNWHLRRRMEHRVEVLDAILQDLAAQTVDHVAVTGDLVNIALPGEFAPAREFLARVGPPDRVSFVPGNHDAYVRASLEHSHRHWGEYMRGDAPAEGGVSTFPYVSRRGDIAIIGTSSAIPTGPFMASGALGEAQLQRLAQLLEELGREGRFRVVLIHHPPVKIHGDRMKRLTDAAAFRALIAKHGAELILHGHIHIRALHWLDGPERPAPSVGVPSASATEHGDERAAYNLFSIERAANGWRCEMVLRGFAPGTHAIAELDRRVLQPPALQPAE
jgi:3',5'-cyclic AMP phosphodiesterase CpdA